MGKAGEDNHIHLKTAGHRSFGQLLRARKVPAQPGGVVTALGERVTPTRHSNRITLLHSLLVC